MENQGRAAKRSLAKEGEREQCCKFFKKLALFEGSEHFERTV